MHQHTPCQTRRSGGWEWSLIAFTHNPHHSQPQSCPSIRTQPCRPPAAPGRRSQELCCSVHPARQRVAPNQPTGTTCAHDLWVSRCLDQVALPRHLRGRPIRGLAPVSLEPSNRISSVGLFVGRKAVKKGPKRPFAPGLSGSLGDTVLGAGCHTFSGPHLAPKGPDSARSNRTWSGASVRKGCKFMRTSTSTAWLPFNHSGPLSIPAVVSDPLNKLKGIHRSEQMRLCATGKPTGSQWTLSPCLVFLRAVTRTPLLLRELLARAPPAPPCT